MHQGVEVTVAEAERRQHVLLAHLHQTRLLVADTGRSSALRMRAAAVALTLVSEIIGASSTTPDTASGRICSALAATAPPMLMPSQKSGIAVVARTASVTASRSRPRSSKRSKYAEM